MFKLFLIKPDYTWFYVFTHHAQSIPNRSNVLQFGMIFQQICRQIFHKFLVVYYFSWLVKSTMHVIENQAKLYLFTLGQLFVLFFLLHNCRSLEDHFSFMMIFSFLNRIINRTYTMNSWANWTCVSVNYMPCHSHRAEASHLEKCVWVWFKNEVQM